jgi:hypothetical protein
MNYKNICQNTLKDCKYAVVSLSIINIKVLEELLDGPEFDSNTTMIEIKTSQSINLFSLELDSFIARRCLYFLYNV